jgi:hypothetical protein
MWGPHACAVMPWGGDCTLGLAWEVAIMMPLQNFHFFYQTRVQAVFEISIMYNVDVLGPLCSLVLK